MHGDLTPAGFALGGEGSGLIRNEEELRKKLTEVFRSVPQVLIEEYLMGWKEVEYEVMRDSRGNCITICNMENFDPLVHGGANRSYGLRYVAATKFADKDARLVPFVFSSTQAYQLEFGDLYMRVFKDPGQVLSGGFPYEIATPYTTANVFNVDFTQGADTMFLALGTLPIYRLRRFADTRWVMETAPIDPVPFDAIGRRAGYWLYPTHPGALVRSLRGLWASMVTLPSCVYSPSRQRISVVFPAPEGPTMATNSPRRTSKLTLSSARICSRPRW